jgi:hypothetical protein
MINANEGGGDVEEWLLGPLDESVSRTAMHMGGRTQNTTVDSFIDSRLKISRKWHTFKGSRPKEQKGINRLN